MIKTSEILRSFPLLRDFAADELETLGSRMEVAKFARGQYLFREGDPGDSVYLLY